MVVGVRYIHAVLYPFVFFPDVKLAPLLLGSGVRARSGLPDIFKFPCRLNGRVSRLRGISLGFTAGRVSGDLLVLEMFLFQGFGKSNQKLVFSGILLVPLSGRLVVGVKVNHSGDEGNGVEI